MSKVQRVTNEQRIAWSPREFAQQTGASLAFIRLEIARANLKAVKRGRRQFIPAHIAREYAGLNLK